MQGSIILLKVVEGDEHLCIGHPTSAKCNRLEGHRTAYLLVWAVLNVSLERVVGVVGSDARQFPIALTH